MELRLRTSWTPTLCLPLALKRLHTAEGAYLCQIWMLCLGVTKHLLTYINILVLRYICNTSTLGLHNISLPTLLNCYVVRISLSLRSTSFASLIVVVLLWSTSFPWLRLRNSHEPGWTSHLRHSVTVGWWWPAWLMTREAGCVHGRPKILNHFQT